MNFDYMPELRYKYSYPILLVVMAVIAVGIGIWLRVRGYLQRIGNEDDTEYRAPKIYPTPSIEIV